MPTIAIVPSDVTSKRMLAGRLGALLIDAGHRVVMLIDEGDDDEIVRRFEWQTIPIRHSWNGARRRWRPFALRRASREAAAALDTPMMSSVLAELDPDLVIVDIEEWEALILAMATTVRPPLAVLCSFFEVWPIAGLGPNDPGPSEGRLDWVRGRLRWWSMWIRMRAYEMKQRLVRGEIDRISVSRALAARLEVRGQFTSREWLHPFAPRNIPMLVCNALELDVPHEPHSGVVHIGSLLEPIDPDPLATMQDRQLADVVASARGAGRPIVLCAFGTLTSGERTPLIRCLVEVAKLRPDYQFVVGATVEGHAHEFGELPNVYVTGWLPQRAVLTVASAAIVHTGNATLHECVAARVPMLIHPLGVNDQQRNAARAIRHGLGVLNGDDLDDAAAMAARLDAVILDDGIRRRLAELAEQVTRYERDGVAVAAVEDLLRPAAGHVTGAV